MTIENTAADPPTDLPVDPAAFWGDVAHDLTPVDTSVSTEVPVLDQLGAAPFKKPDKGGFPFLGFLAGVYEHVSTSAQSELHPTTGVIGPTP
jgi:hypothetical protein